jgi:hypothetical protein
MTKIQEDVESTLIEDRIHSFSLFVRDISKVEES